jgi:hypothetical protein
MRLIPVGIDAYGNEYAASEMTDDPSEDEMGPVRALERKCGTCLLRKSRPVPWTDEEVKEFLDQPADRFVICHETTTGDPAAPPAMCAAYVDLRGLSKWFLFFCREVKRVPPPRPDPIVATDWTEEPRFAAFREAYAYATTHFSSAASAFAKVDRREAYRIWHAIQLGMERPADPCDQPTEADENRQTGRRP